MKQILVASWVFFHSSSFAGGSGTARSLVRFFDTDCEGNATHLRGEYDFDQLWAFIAASCTGSYYCDDDTPEIKRVILAAADSAQRGDYGALSRQITLTVKVMQLDSEPVLELLRKYLVPYNYEALDAAQFFYPGSLTAWPHSPPLLFSEAVSALPVGTQEIQFREGLYKFDVYQVRMNVLALMKLFRHKQQLSSQCRSSLVLTLKTHEPEWPRQIHQEDDYPADGVFAPE